MSGPPRWFMRPVLLYIKNKTKELTMKVNTGCTNPWHSSTENRLCHVIIKKVPELSLYNLLEKEETHKDILIYVLAYN
jgi:hypothetical protein